VFTDVESNDNTRNMRVLESVSISIKTLRPMLLVYYDSLG
jgi:hypothetical protein